MKKIIIAIMLVFCVATVRAENTNISTSQYYVDTNAATRQDAVPANNANSVMTYDSVSPDGIGAKAIYDTTAAYETQTNALVTAATANAAIQNGINSEFVCANPPKCNLWDMTAVSNADFPTGYTRLEYIESTGDQYINTGILSTTDEFGVDIKYMPTMEYGDNHSEGVLGAQTSDYTNGFTINFRNKCMIFGEGCYIHTPSIIALNVVHTVNIKISNNQVRAVFDNESIYNGVLLGSIVSNAPIFLFGYGFGNRISVASHYHGRVYYCKIYQNGVLVRDFVPARQNSTGVLGMYDLVTNTFFTNNGTGTFGAASYLPQNQ